MTTIDYKQKIKDYMNSSEVDTLYKSMLNNLFPELKESEDERVKKEIISAIKEDWSGHTDWIDWLEKQGEHANFLSKIQVGDKVTRNEDGVLVNLSQLKRVAKKGNMGISEATKQKLEDNLNKALEKETPESWNEFLDEQKPAAWSEEDENRINRLIAYFEDEESFTAEDDIVYANWLKSLRPQNTWKPSDEQMNALNYVVNLMASSERPTENDLYYNILKSLRQQLMKLKDEK